MRYALDESDLEEDSLEEEWEIVSSEEDLEPAEAQVTRDDDDLSSSLRLFPDVTIEPLSTNSAVESDEALVESGVSKETQVNIVPPDDAFIEKPTSVPSLEEPLRSSDALRMETNDQPPVAPKPQDPVPPPPPPPVLLSLSRSFRRASRKLKSAVEKVDERFDVAEKTERGLSRLSKSTRSLSKNIRSESERVGKHMQGACVQTERAAKAAAVKLRQATRKAGERASRLNEKYHITDAVATTAAATGAVLLSRGKVKEGTGTLVFAGATVVAGEVLRAPQRHQDVGLNEELHME